MRTPETWIVEVVDRGQCLSRHIVGTEQETVKLAAPYLRDGFRLCRCETDAQRLRDLGQVAFLHVWRL